MSPPQTPTLSSSLTRSPSDTNKITFLDTSVNFAAQRELLVPVSEHLEHGRGLPWSYLMKELAEDLTFVPAAMAAVPAVLVAVFGFGASWVLIRLVLFLGCAKVALHSLELSALKFSARARDYWQELTAATVLRRILCSLVFVWPLTHKTIGGRESSVCFLSEVMYPSFLLAFLLSYQRHVRAFVSQTKARSRLTGQSIDNGRCDPVATGQAPSGESNCDDGHAIVYKYFIDQMVSKGFHWGIEWPGWYEQQNGVSLAALGFAVIGSAMPQLYKSSCTFGGGMCTAGDPGTPSSAFDVGASLASFSVCVLVRYFLFTYLTWCRTTSQQAIVNKLIFSALTSMERLEQLHARVCIGDYGHVQSETCAKCSGCLKFPRASLTTASGLKMWYGLRSMVCVNWVLPRAQVEAGLSAYLVVLLFEIVLMGLSWADAVSAGTVDTSELRVSIISVVLLYDMLILGILTLMLVLDSLTRNHLMDAGIEELDAALESLYLAPRIGEFPRETLEIMNFLEFARRRISESSHLKDRLFGVVVNRQLAGVLASSFAAVVAGAVEVLF